jgi:O-antigen ligase
MREGGFVPASLNPLILIVAALTVINVSRSHYIFPWLLALRPGLLLFVMAVTVLALRPRLADFSNLTKSWPALSLFAFAILACLSAIFGLSLGQSAQFIIQDYSRTLVYAGLLVVAMKSVRELDTILWAILIGCAIVAYTGIFVFTPEVHAGNAVARLNDFYEMDANDIGCVLAIGLPLSIPLLRNARAGLRPWILLVAIAMIITIGRAGSRGTFVGILAMGLMLLVIVRGVSLRRRFAIVVIAAAVLGIAAPPGYWEQMRSIVDTENNYNYTELEGRRALALRGLRYMFMYPVFGVGVSNFSRAECTIPDAARLAAGDVPNCMAPHNSLVEMASEMGIPGALLWIAVLGGGTIGILRLRRRLPQSFVMGTPEERLLASLTTYLPVAIVGFAITSLFVTFAMLSPVYILIALMATTYVQVRRHLRQHLLRVGGAPQPVAT